MTLTVRLVCLALRTEASKYLGIKPRTDSIKRLGDIM